MPIYEEKLICPLAVRFSQDHIRPDFLDGSCVEDAIKAIKTKPGSGEYDIVLEPPFPAIEVIRGHLKSGVAHHWLSLDNRRLYCLQQAAVAHWPLRAAVVVEALRAPTDGMRKKVNSSVDGLSVGIGHSPATLTGRWDWHQEVQDRTAQAADLAHRLVTMDDAKANIQDLADAPAPPSMLDRFLQNEKAGIASDASTAEPRSPRESESSNDVSIMHALSTSATVSQEPAGDWVPDLSGAWEDDKGNSYTVTWATDCSFSCLHKNATGNRRKVTLWYDEKTDSLSWGDDWSLWADASDVRNKSNNCVSWCAARDTAKRKPRFEWGRVKNQDAHCSKQTRRPKSNKKATGL